MSVEYLICRTCGKPSEDDGSNLFPLFNSVDYQNELAMTRQEFEIWNLNILENDGLPQKICLTCFDSFCQIHNFRLMCAEAQVNFGEMCTGLDIIIKTETGIADEEDFPDDYNGTQIVTVQEHYSFPGVKRKELLKDSSPPDPFVVGDTEQIDNVDEELIPPYDHYEVNEIDGIVPELKKYKCEYCMYLVSFDDPDELNDHYNKLHCSEQPYTCPKCDKCFEKIGKRNNHAQSHFRVSITCEVCGKNVKGGKQMMAYHIGYNHVQEDRQCPTCDKKFDMITMRNFNCHVSHHDDSRLHKCKFCDKKFIQTTELLAHEKTHNGEFPFKCKECVAEFANKDLLNEHVKKHVRLQCPFCFKKFKNQHRLNIHMELHNPNRKLISCDLCNLKFGCNMNLRIHKYRKHNAPASQAILNVIQKREVKQPQIKPYKCTECTQSYILHSQLVKHMKIHQEIRPFVCELCSKCFKREAHLKFHVDSLHKKKKPYKCTECGWAFPLKNNLREHFLAKHKTTRDFKCHLCDKTFATGNNLRVHLISHSDKKPYVCTICNRGYKLLSILKSHMSRHLRRNEADVTGQNISDALVEDEDLL